MLSFYIRWPTIWAKRQKSSNGNTTFCLTANENLVFLDKLFHREREREREQLLHNFLMENAIMKER